MKKIILIFICMIFIFFLISKPKLNITSSIIFDPQSIWIPTIATHSVDGDVTSLINESDDSTSVVDNNEYIDITLWNETMNPSATDIVVIFYFEVDVTDTNFEWHVNITSPASLAGEACLIDPNGVPGNYSCNLTAAGVDTPDELNSLDVRLIGVENPDQGPPDNGEVDYVYLNITYILIPYLQVSLEEPPSITNIPQNQTFTVNATVYCQNGECGNVQGIVRYNSTGLNPDQAISTIPGAEPFYVLEQNPLSCPTNPLTDGEFCNLTWRVNATGQIGSDWKVGVLFSSDDPSVSDNHTSNSTVSITTCTIDIDAAWSRIDFGVLQPGQSIEAPGNQNHLYNITILDTTTCPSDIYLMGTDLQNGTSIIGVGNITWNSTQVSQKSLSKTYQLAGSSLDSGTNLTTFYWISVPTGIPWGKYNGTLYVKKPP